MRGRAGRMPVGRRRGGSRARPRPSGRPAGACASRSRSTGPAKTWRPRGPPTGFGQAV